MIRITHLTGSLQGTASLSPKAVIRIGRGEDCDVRFDPRLDARVSTHHAEIRFEDGQYVVVDVGSTNGTLVNGKLVRTHKLRSGDKIAFGAQGGPEVRFDIEEGFRSNGASYGSAYAVQAAAAVAPVRRPPPNLRPPPAVAAAPSQDAAELAREAQLRIAQARASSKGQPSGQTMFIMADTFKKVEDVTQRKGRKRTGKIVTVILTLSLVGFGALGFVIWQQKKQIEQILHRKDSLDKQISKIQLAMQLESDPEKLASLEEQLTLLTGKAQAAVGEIQQKDKTEAQKIEQSGDELDREIRRILTKFNSQTYAVPPIFKDRLKHYIDRNLRQAGTRTIYKRKQQYWPLIVKEFSALGLPEEMGYVAWQESGFDPLAESSAKARGMWQFMDFRAREFGMRVDLKRRIDDRTDVLKSTKGAARYLANLLAEFGEDSFMLAIASYNKGENGMRRVLHDIAQQPGGFRKDKRDFWHLYRLKKLPEETLEYVPQILAAAIIGNDPKKYGLE
ncbi:MAG TPA: transglycosylase SLT domain-containing protein [Myxococcales bacterium]|nr:transglycosylase SLT domain-containing protein [Myxococcales bacterium]